MPAGGQAEWPEGQPARPVRSGTVPPLADGFSTRPETSPNLAAALVPGTAVALVPARPTTAGVRDWLGACGKTQLAVYAAESLWQSAEVTVLVWAVASNRASVLTSYAQAALTVLGSDAAGDADAIAAAFVGWLASTSQPWLVVLDDLTTAADLAGLWPDGPAGRVLITAASPAVLPAESQVRVVPVGPFSPREALSYLMGRLTADTDQRLGAIDLVADLSSEPLALAQASGVIASSALSCRDYRGYFVDRRAQLTEVPGAKPPAAAVTWRFSVEQADRLAPGGAAQPLLALAALLDGHGIPATVFSTQAATGYLASPATGGAGPAGPGERARDALLVLERTGLLDIDTSAAPPTSPDEPGDPGCRAGRDAGPDARPGGAGGRGRAARRVAPRRAGSLAGRQPALLRGQPAAGRRQAAAGRRLPSAAAAGRPEPGPGPAQRPGRGLLAGAGHRVREHARARASRIPSSSTSGWPRRTWPPGGRARPSPGSSGCRPTGSRRSARTTRAPPRPAATWVTP